MAEGMLLEVGAKVSPEFTKLDAQLNELITKFEKKYTLEVDVKFANGKATQFIRQLDDLSNALSRAGAGNGLSSVADSISNIGSAANSAANSMTKLGKSFTVSKNSGIQKIETEYLNAATKIESKIDSIKKKMASAEGISPHAKEWSSYRELNEALKQYQSLQRQLNSDRGINSVALSDGIKAADATFKNATLHIDEYIAKRKEAMRYGDILKSGGDLGSTQAKEYQTALTSVKNVLREIGVLQEKMLNVSPNADSTSQTYRDLEAQKRSLQELMGFLTSGDGIGKGYFNNSLATIQKQFSETKNFASDYIKNMSEANAANNSLIASEKDYAQAIKQVEQALSKANQLQGKVSQSGLSGSGMDAQLKSTIAALEETKAKLSAPLAPQFKANVDAMANDAVAAFSKIERSFAELDTSKLMTSDMAQYNNAMKTVIASSANVSALINKNMSLEGFEGSDAYNKLVKVKEGFDALEASMSGLSIAQYKEWLSNLNLGLEQAGISLEAFIAEFNRTNVISSGTREYNNALNQTKSLIEQATAAQRNFTKAQNGKSSGAYNSLATYISDLRKLQTELNSGNLSPKDYATRFASIQSGVSGAITQIHQAGEATSSWGNYVDAVRNKFGHLFSASAVVMRLVGYVKQLASYAIELDSAMTQVRIVTNATDSQMTSFLSTSISLAKELGQNVKDVVSSVETFSRLGYSLSEATTMSHYSALLGNVAGVNSDEATSGLTAIVKGYDMQVENAEHVADVLVGVGQSYAVSAAEMIEAYEKSGAALSATGTSFEKSAGLIAAGNAAVKCMPQICGNTY